MTDALKAYDFEKGHLNPNPQQAYELLMTIENAPGVFADVMGSVQYDVENEWECGHIDRVRGTPNRITNLEPFKMEPLGDNRYRGVFYLDRMLDEAYYGRDICRWVVIAAGVRLRATGNDKETRFLPGIFIEDILAEGKATTYFWRGGYPMRSLENFADYGSRDVNKFREEIRNELFSITLEARRVTP